MARRKKKSDTKLIALAIIAAPFIWLQQKVGTSGLVLLGIILIAGIIISRMLGGKKRTRKSPRQTRNQSSISIPSARVDDIFGALDEIDMTDYLGMAAESGRKARAAIDAGDFDCAWRHYHEQKNHYLSHAKRSEFTPQQIIVLDGSVHRSLANILRIEERHHDALIHFLYYLATSPKRTKADDKQLVAYFNRSNIKSVHIPEVRDFIDTLGPCPNFRSIQAECSQWSDAAERR